MEKVKLAIVIMLKEHEDGMKRSKLNETIRAEYGYDEKSVEEAIDGLIKERLVVGSMGHCVEAGRTYRVTPTSEDKLYLTTKLNYGEILSRFSEEA